MKLSLTWLKDYVELDATVDEIKRAITFLGLEVEQVIQTGAPKLSNVVVGEVLTRDKHPNADKLSVCTVDIGPAGGVKTIVCGAQNYKVGDRVPVALPGAVLPGDFVIKQSKIRGHSSDGMMCSAKELGAAEDASGLLILESRPAVGTPINEVLPPGDTVFDIEVTPNRPDCLCHLGVARELAAWFHKELRYPEIKFNGAIDANAIGSQHPELLAGVAVEAPEDCPLYSAHVVKGVKIGPSPEWMQRRLSAAGLRPINNIVDVTNFVLLEYGQPLHAFDAKKLAGGRIIVRRAREGEATTLDGKERSLSERMLVIADAEKSVVVAGVMGGENWGVDETTVDIVLEAAVFRRQSVRWTSKKLGLSSDSSYRFERGIDAHSTLEAAHRALDLIVQTAGGRIVGPIHIVGGDKPWKREIVVTTGYIRERAGFEISDVEMRSALESLELGILREEKAGSEGLSWTVSVPSWRDDLDRPIDLVEEVLRLYGTDRIPPAVVQAPGLLAEDDPIVRFNREVTEFLVGQNFHECVNYTLRPEKEVAAWTRSSGELSELRLLNPFVEDQSQLRPTLVSGLLESLRLNQSRGMKVSRLFETGRIFLKHEQTGDLLECATVAFVIAESDARTWLARPNADFYTAKHLVTRVAALAGVTLPALVHAADSKAGPCWQPQHAACAGEIRHGWHAGFGLVNLQLTSDIKGRVLCGEFAVLPEKLTAAGARRRYTPFSLMPAALRDLALVVEASTPAEEVRKTLAKVARAAVGSAFSLEEVEVFDVYQGKGLPEGRKSLAFSLVFRSPERTLTDDEVNKVFEKVQADLAATTSYQVRK